MKILAIRGKNLASLEGEFAIDFMSEPLRSSGIFAVTGSTGSGKSTILDCLCLALFNETPRANKASKSVDVVDVLDKTIKQNDSRNTLRRGAIEGIAEVDFTALSGDTYRSTWMVRRARNRADGAMQASTMRLQNLTTGIEEQGTKTELLAKVVKVIGLTFYQFTRAVLLAQGDFATFLKAPKREKAELLEKLTETDIYSKISVSIFERTKQAENQLKTIHERMKDVKLLSEDELVQHTQEKENVGTQLKSVHTELNRIEKSLTWLKNLDDINVALAQAKASLNETSKELEATQPRFLYMEQLDASQAIRDTYLQHSQKLKALEELKTNGEKQKQLVVEKEAKYKDLLLQHDEAKKKVEELELRFAEKKPEIEEAKKLDVSLVATQKEVETSKGECDRYSQEVVKLRLSIKNQEDLQTAFRRSIAELKSWFEEKKNYIDIVQRVDLIANLLEVVAVNKQQYTSTKQSIAQTEVLISTQQALVKQYETDFERLNQQLSTEILALRTKLIDKEACLVCGSIEHPYAQHLDSGNGLEEKELEASKLNIKQAIDQAQKELETARTNLAKMQGLSENFALQSESAKTKLSAYLQTLPNWEELLDNVDLKQQLEDLAKQWKQYSEKLEADKQRLEHVNVSFESDSLRLAQSLPVLSQWQKRWEDATQKHDADVAQRQQLLKGQSVESVETFIESTRKDSAQQYEQWRVQKEKLEAEKSQLLGSLQQLDKNIESTEKDINDLQATIQNWLATNTQHIDAEALTNLMAKSQAWIQQEKDALQALKNKELAFTTSVNERTERLTAHLSAEDRVEGELDKTTFVAKQTELQGKQEQLADQKMKAEIALRTHDEAKQKIKAFEKELETLTIRYENWKKLNSLLGSGDGSKFKAIAQGYTLDVLLGFANKHLAELTMRYKLERIPDSLELQVLDQDMADGVRSVHYLSGGESFLVSLSLALGLSSLSSNRMKIESLFIDEGFGSLDIETLSLAMDALENLQTQGRKIGVITHVTEMTERIRTQIRVTKQGNGKSKVSVIG